MKRPELRSLAIRRHFGNDAQLSAFRQANTTGEPARRVAASRVISFAHVRISASGESLTIVRSAQLMKLPDEK